MTELSPPPDQPADATASPTGEPSLPTTEPSPLDGATASPTIEPSPDQPADATASPTVAPPPDSLDGATASPTGEPSPDSLDGATASPTGEPSPDQPADATASPTVAPHLPITEPLPSPDQPADATASPVVEPHLPPTEPLSPRDQAEALMKAGVAQIAATLNEHDWLSVNQIWRIVDVLGLATTEAIVAEALHIEADGGMLTVDGTRRRTLGGVFFFLVRTRVSPEQRRWIFPWFIVHTQQAPADGTPSAPPIMWADREALIADLFPTSGTVTSVKVTLIGRPTHVDIQFQFTRITLSSTGPLPALPKGIPAPLSMPTTTYSVYITKKQWNLVVKALREPKDALIVEGMQILDLTTKIISVFATRTTTKLLQQASRVVKPPA